MNSDIPGNFDFDTWERLVHDGLVHDDVSSFEPRRQALIERILEAAPAIIQRQAQADRPSATLIRFPGRG